MTSPLGDHPVGPAIVRVLAGTGTAADETDLREWLAGDPERQRQLSELRAIWTEAGTLQRDWDTTRLQQRILAVSNGSAPIGVVSTGTTPPLRSDEQPVPFRTRPLTRVRQRTWLPVVAAAALLITVGALVWRPGIGRGASTRIEQAPLTEIATRRGQQATLRLADGTRITLGVDSRLRYPESFADGASREVYLEGEAYFEVARDSGRPFMVYTGDAVTRVLGTRFGVRAYAEDRRVQVMVAEGKVALGRPTATEVVLGGGDLGVLEAGGAPSVRHGVDIASYLAWTDRRLVFIDTPASEVAQQLSRWYDVDVRLGDPSLADAPFTMSLRGDEAPTLVLQTLADAVGGRLERRGTAHVILRKSAGPVDIK